MGTAFFGAAFCQVYNFVQIHIVIFLSSSFWLLLTAEIFLDTKLMPYLDSKKKTCVLRGVSVVSKSCYSVLKQK